MRTLGGLLAVLAFLLATRLAQRDLVWVEEAYPTAAAQQVLAGKTLYRDIWFDKPPLFPAVYLLWAAQTGVPLRIGGALFAFACCVMLWWFARQVWGEHEGLAAAALLAFFLTFDFPSAVMALAPDLLMLLPHAAAVYLAWRGRPLLSGLAAGFAMLVNPKAVLILPVCALWLWRTPLPLLAGAIIPNAVALAWLFSTGALEAYWQQVYQWGFRYSADTFLSNPLREGIVRTLGWLWFHAAIAAGAAWVLWRERKRRFAAWIAIALVSVAIGLRFFPRYYFVLLPPFCILAARAFITTPALRIAMALLLLIPAVRFGGRLLNHNQWTDTAMMDDSRAAAALLNARKQPGDTLLVWGYRPDIFAFTGIPAGTRFLDSQPLTGVIADRHLTSSHVAAPDHRAELLDTTPTFIVDGLGPYNPALAISRYDDLRSWLAAYDEIARTHGAVVYQRKSR